MEPTLNFDSHFISDSVESFVTLESVGGQGYFSGNNSPSGAKVCFENNPIVSVPDHDTGNEDTPIDLTATEPCSASTVNHCVKVISHHSKDGITIHKWETRRSMFRDVDILKASLLLDFKRYILNDEFLFGFIAPGHGSKGRQVSLQSNSDLGKMYEEHKCRKEIVLWLKVVKQRKRPLSNSTDINIEPKKPSSVEQGSSGGSNYQGHLKHFSDIQCIVEKLEETHAGDYTPEQLRAWAHMIDMKKHSSYETPPQKPFFKRAASVKEKEQSSISPGKRIRYRSECINQLDKWHELLEKGVIDTEQFKELQDTILHDIKQF